MKLDSQQIINEARRQRDLDTSAMHVKPWGERHHHFQVPSWLVTLPAAAIVGFIFGLFFNKSTSNETAQLMAAADTIYVTQEVLVPQKSDTIIRYVERPVKHKTVKAAQPAVASSPNLSTPTTGCSIDQDNIDYTMLVMK